MMASGGENQENLIREGEMKIEKERMVVQELLVIFQSLDIMKNEEKLQALIQSNPWLLERVSVFYHNQEKEFYKVKTEEEVIQLQHQESSEMHEDSSMKSQLKHKTQHVEWLTLACGHANFMKIVHEMYLETRPDRKMKDILDAQEKLINSRQKYINEWQEVAPLLSYMILMNHQSLENEIHFCVDNFEDQLRREMMDFRANVLIHIDVFEKQRRAQRPEMRRLSRQMWLREQKILQCEEYQKLRRNESCKKHQPTSHLSKYERLERIRKRIQNRRSEEDLLKQVKQGESHDVV